MAKNLKSFFTNNEVLFIGFSSNPQSFSRSVYKDFTDNGIKVFPMNSKKFTEDGIEVFNDLSQLDHIPESAYILLNKENTGKAVERLQGTSVKKIMFQNKDTVDEATLSKCKDMGMETVVACPRMIFSKGFMHKLHGFFAGVR